MAGKKIDYETILACKAGDSEALSRVLVHYDKLINSAASKIVIDEQGRKTVTVDQELKQNIQQTLMLQIFLKYDHLSGPNDMNEERDRAYGG